MKLKSNLLIFSKTILHTQKKIMHEIKYSFLYKLQLLFETFPDVMFTNEMKRKIMCLNSVSCLVTTHQFLLYFLMYSIEKIL